MSSDLTNFSPKNLAEAIDLAERFSKTAMVPKIYQGNPDAILVAWQMGAELNLQPMQSLQNIAVINGTPSIYGDAALAIVRTHPDFESIDEHFEFADEAKGEIAGAVCVVKRRDEPEVVRRFTMADAQRANLLTKQGPWKEYPKRMLQLRARGFALRDAFPDALKGLRLAEEVRDIPDMPVVNEPVNIERELPQIEAKSRSESLKAQIARQTPSESISDVSAEGDVSHDESEKSREVEA